MFSATCIDVSYQGIVQPNMEPKLESVEFLLHPNIIFIDINR